MASSSKIQFKLETLREKAIEAIDRQLEEKFEELNNLQNDPELAERIQDWRKNQDAALRELADTLGATSNEDLAAFKIEAMPRVNYGRTDRIEKDIRQLQRDRIRVEAKSASLVADDDGNISLTKTQLTEFFGL